MSDLGYDESSKYLYVRNNKWHKLGGKPLLTKVATLCQPKCIKKFLQ
jgi:hypothetical protein